MRQSIRMLIAGIVVGVIATIAFYETRKPAGGPGSISPPSAPTYTNGTAPTYTNGTAPTYSIGTSPAK
jgi:hypothetical protein